MWRGAFATGSLFTIGKFLIGLYLGKAPRVSAPATRPPSRRGDAWDFAIAALIAIGFGAVRAFTGRRRPT